MTIDVLNVVFGAVGFLGTSVDFVQLELLQDTSGQKETSGISRGVVGETDLNTISRQLV